MHPNTCLRTTARRIRLVAFPPLPCFRTGQYFLRPATYALRGFAHCEHWGMGPAGRGHIASESQNPLSLKNRACVKFGIHLRDSRTRPFSLDGPSIGPIGRRVGVPGPHVLCVYYAWRSAFIGAALHSVAIRFRLWAIWKHLAQALPASIIRPLLFSAESDDSSTSEPVPELGYPSKMRRVWRGSCLRSADAALRDDWEDRPGKKGIHQPPGRRPFYFYGDACK